MNIALIQQSFSDDRDSNWRAIETAVEQAAQHADLVLLPELHNGVYFCQQRNDANFARAETIPGDTSRFLSELARQNNVVIVGSVFEKSGDQYFNTALVLDSDGSLVGTYRKSTLPNDPGYYEQYYFSRNTGESNIIETRVGKLGVMVCFDQWFPEIARTLTRAGADILLYPTAIGFDPTDTAEQQQRDLDAWITVQRGHAIANVIPLAACNRTGFEATPDEKLSNGIDFWGSSFICGQQGEMIARGSTDKNEIIVGTVDLSRTEPLRRVWTFHDELK